MRISDSFTAGERQFDEVLSGQPVDEPAYCAPRAWPHQVPEEHRRRST